MPQGVELPQALVDTFSFATSRAIHTNLLVAWMLLGFMGGADFILPAECERELHSTKIAYLQLVLFAAAAVAAVVGFLFGWTQGKPLLEIPFPLDYCIVVGALIFLFNVGMTMLRAQRRTVIQGSLLGGLVFLAGMYLFNLPFYANLSIDWYYWWWVIHLWVEGAWELVAAALTAWILIKITGVSRETLKLFLKEDIIPARADRPIFYIAPVIGVIAALSSLAVIPWWEGFKIADINVGILYILALSSVGAYCVILGGWASNSKYSFLGGLRSSAQVISYEIAMGLSLVGVMMMSGSANLSDIVKAQSENWFIWSQPLACFVFVMSAIAETNRAPFDLTEAETELVAGFATEYSGMRWALFFMAEYASHAP